jgi:hypothetical protein
VAVISATVLPSGVFPAESAGSGLLSSNAKREMAAERGLTYAPSGPGEYVTGRLPIPTGKRPCAPGSLDHFSSCCN